MDGRGGLKSLCGIIIVVLLAPNIVAPVCTQDVGDALNYLRGRQTAEGDIGGFAVSAWVVMALAASGEDPQEWEVDGSPSIIDYLRDHSYHLGDEPTDYERFILALTAANENPSSFGGVDYLSRLKDYYNDGQIGDREILNDDFWGVLALVSAGERRSQIVQASKEYIIDNQNDGGGWGFAVGRMSDVDDTAAAIMALIAAGEDSDSEVIRRALGYLKACQRDDGGFPWNPTSDTSNSLSTSWAVCAITASGESPKEARWTVNNRNPIDLLLSLQDDDGAFKWTASSRSNPEYTTACVIPALSGKTYPIVIDPQVKVRVEGEDSTIWSGTVSLSGDFTFTAHNSGKSYTMSAECPLGGLDAASDIDGFSYTVNDQWYPPDLYVDNIEGEGSWAYRVNGVSPWYGCGYGWLGSGPDLSNGDEILWFFTSTWMELPLRISVDKTSMSVGEVLKVTVTTTEEDYYHNPPNPWPDVKWVPVSGATIHADQDYLTDMNGEVTITMDTVGTYNIFAEKDNYIRSEKIQIHISEEKPEEPLNVWLSVDHNLVEVGSPVTISGYSYELGSNLERENLSLAYYIHLYADPPTPYITNRIASFRAEEDGTFTLQWTPESTGTYRIIGYVGGGGNYGPGFTDNYVTVTVYSTDRVETSSYKPLGAQVSSIYNDDHLITTKIEIKNPNPTGTLYRWSLKIHGPDGDVVYSNGGGRWIYSDEIQSYTAWWRPRVQGEYRMEAKVTLLGYYQMPTELESTATATITV